jgi:transcriptional regulator with XRE-family HTH domain
VVKKAASTYPTGMSKHPELIALGKQIRVLRKEKGFSQESFADYVGLDRSYIGAVERGERNISVLNLIRVAKALNVSMGDLFI